MAVSREFIDFLVEQLEDFGPVAVKRMFGGVGLFRDGRMFALVVGDVLYFKTDAENAPAFEAEGLAPFSYTTKKAERVVMSYRRAPERCLDDREEMASWARSGFGAAMRSKK